ncbi:hypothetical protein IKG07_02045 [Candidatus Saccharibacteria bacterium]|nr:hypothetical protein [Candidatus Saccharibacteria bacterium]
MAFKIHGSSINEYNKIFANYDEYKSESIILGTSRSIRSDEWLGHAPYFMSQYYNDYEKNNDLVSLGGHDMILGHNTPVKDITMVAKPFTWGYIILGNEYGLSWYWCLRLILLILVSFEACIIITKGNKKVALLGAIMVAFAPAVQWWFVAAVDVFIWGLTLFVAAYYFFTTEKWKRWLFTAILPVSAIAYVMALYPPLQIPVGLVMLTLFIVCLIRDKKEITFKKKDIWRIVIMALFALGVLGWMLWNSRDAIVALYSTVYPGKRVSLGGGEGIGGLFTDLTSFVLPYKQIPYSNSSEVSTFIQFAPVLLMLYPLIWKKMKRDKNMIVGNALLVCIIVMFVFMSVGFPELLAKLSLFSYIDSFRMEWAYGFVGVLFTVWGIDMIWKKQIFSKKQIFGVIAIFGFLYICLVGSKELSYLSWKYYIVLIVGLMILVFLMLKRYQKLFLVGTAAVVLAAGATVNPIAKGTTAVFGHPLEQKIREIASDDKDAHWIALNTILLQQLGIANGAKMLNALNFYPDYTKWKIIDPDGKYDDYYNRYAHLVVTLTDDDTEYISGVTADNFTLKLSCDDALKWPTKYLLSAGKLNACTENFEEIYADTEGEYYIYERVTK